jgi:rhodanese-related sulfurtransferase
MNSRVNVSTLSRTLENENIQLIDVREYAEFAAGRVVGAKLIPLGEIEKRQEEINHSQKIYVMCRTGNRSNAAQRKLETLGFTNVINVEGGFDAWKKENLPFEKDAKAPWGLERQVRFTAGLLVLTGVILSLAVHPYFIGIAAFVGAGLTFSGATDWCGMAIFLAKMPWNRSVQTGETKVSANELG